MAKKALVEHALNIRQSCQAFGISETCFRYEAKLSDENAEIADWLLRLTAWQRNWGFGLCFLYLRNVKGFGWNHKRVYRIYRELALNMRIKPKKRLLREKPDIGRLGHCERDSVRIYTTWQSTAECLCGAL